MKTNTFRMLSLTAATLLCSQLAVAQETVPAKPITPPPGAAAPAPAAAKPDAKPETPPAKDVVELDLRAFQKVMRTQPAKPFNEMTPLERAQFGEDRGMEARQRALAFLSLYPNDPRRWNVISGLYSGTPRFVLQWGEPDAEGKVEPLAVDEAAAAAWKEKVKALQTEMKTAADLPQDIKDMFARQAENEAKQKAFEAKWKSGKEKAPDFTAYTLDQKPVKISDYRGKVVVLDFWASWCGPCKAAMPHVNELAEKYKKQGVVVIGSGTSDTREAFEKFITENKDKYPNVVWTHDKEERGDNRASKALYGVSGIPTQFVIDRKGRVVDVVVGYMKGEVILDAALAKAGIKVDSEILAQAEADLKKRGS